MKFFLTVNAKILKKKTLQKAVMVKNLLKFFIRLKWLRITEIPRISLISIRKFRSQKETKYNDLTPLSGNLSLDVVNDS